MRGIHINNYIDNRIVLSGRKLKNEVQAVMHSQKPKPMVIDHLKQHRQLKQLKNQPDYIQDQLKTAKNVSSCKHKRKRNKTTHGRQHREHHSHDKNRIKKSLEQLKGNMLSHNKKSNSSSPSKQSDTINMLETHRRLKPIYDDHEHGHGLGKRTKSAIIKRTKQPKFDDKYKNDQHSKSGSKQQQGLEKKRQKMINQSKKNLKIREQIKNKSKEIEAKQKHKQIKAGGQKNRQIAIGRQKKSKSKKSLIDNNVKRVPSAINLSIKSKKKNTGINSSATTSRKTSRPQSKSHIVSSVVSKPASARGYKKIKGSQISAQINRKIFQNQGIQGELYNNPHNQYNNKEIDAKLQKINLDGSNVKRMVSQLEKALNTAGSRKKAQKQLQILLAKMQAMDSDEDEHNQSEMVNPYEQVEIQKDTNMYLPRNKLPDEDQSQQQQQSSKKTMKKQQIIVNEDNQIEQTSFNKIQDIGINHIISGQDILDAPQQNDSQSHQSSQKLSPQDKSVQLIQFDPDQDISQSHEQVSIQNHIHLMSNRTGPINLQEVYERIGSDQLHHYPQASSIEPKNNMKKRPIPEDNYGEQNPMLSRRSKNEKFPLINLNEYDSVKSHQDQKQAQISQLKKFQQQSNTMMEKIKKMQKKQELTINIDEPHPTPDKVMLENQKINDTVQNQDIDIPQKTPKNSQMYGFQRYPFSNLNQLKSPKFNQQSINQIISLKQKVQSSHHDKLSQLVNVLFEKNMVSPKTHQFQVSILDQKYQKESKNLKNYQKHADQLSKILSQIRKQKQQIHGIQQLIRSEKWHEALDIVKKQQQTQRTEDGIKRNKLLTRQGGDNDNLKNYVEQKSDQKSEQSDTGQQIVYYSGQHQQQNSQASSYVLNNTNSDDGFKLIKVASQGNEVIEYTSNEEYKSGQESQNVVACAQQSTEQVISQQYGNNLNQSVIKIDENQQQAEEQAVVPKQRGFQSNLFFIKEYCIALCQFVRDAYRKQFKATIGQPIAYNLQELLEGYRIKKDQTPAVRINSLYEQLSYHNCLKKADKSPITQFMFDEFNTCYQGIKYFGKSQTQDAALQGIFLKSIFNALNQSLSIQRPGSIHGRPLPWSHSAKHLKNMKNSENSNSSNNFVRNSQSQDLIFGIAIARIIQWGSCLCGFIPDTIELQNTQIDEEYINHIRQTRMALLLQKMLSDEQAQMSQMQLQQTEVKLYLAQIITNQLFKQVEEDMKAVKKRSTLRKVDY